MMDSHNSNTTENALLAVADDETTQVIVTNKLNQGDNDQIIGQFDEVIAEYDDRNGHKTN